MKVISYNLRKHRAAGELADLVERYGADVLCLQEATRPTSPTPSAACARHTRPSATASASPCTTARTRYRAVEVRASRLKKSLHDRVLKPAEERMLGVRCTTSTRTASHRASFHAAPLTALNSLRRHQIRTALASCEELGLGLPALMVGDYNYPVFKENLGQKVREQGYELSLSDSRTYTRYRFFRGHYDFATSVGFTMPMVKTLPQGRPTTCRSCATPSLRRSASRRPDAVAGVGRYSRSRRARVCSARSASSSSAG